MTLKLFYAPVTCALVAHVNLLEAGASFEVQALNFGKSEQRAPEFLAINPKHRVPTLVIDGRPLTENVAIQMWIAKNFSEKKLLPSDSFQEMQAIAFMSWCASSIHPSLTPCAFPKWFCDVPGTQESVRRLAVARLAESFSIADNLLADRDWFFRDYSVADAYFFWCFRRAKQVQFDTSLYTRCTAHMHRMLLRPSVEKTLQLEARVLKEFGMVLPS
jgi:glutathione S-transferase